MTIESGVVISRAGEALHWHLPAGRSAVYIPDTRELWNVLWDHRSNLAGFAHTHPGAGIPVPSLTDLTTFLAIEEALGMRLSWWIVSDDNAIECHHLGGDRPHYERAVLVREPHWVAPLRELSRGPNDARINNAQPTERSHK